LNKKVTVAPCKLACITLLAILTLSLGLLSVNSVIAQTDQAAGKLQAANMAVDQAFVAVLDAEKAGANVTNLLSQLNIVDGDLASAENSYRTGDLNNAVNQADNVLPLTQQITSAAQSAKQDALASERNATWTSVALTVVGSFVFVLVLFIVWRYFKRYYINELSEAKPEVVDQ
jgi:CHASE3 domain sensor protein